MKSLSRGRWYIYSVIIVFGALHQDFWAWHDIGLPWSPERVFQGDGNTREFEFDFPVSKPTMLRVLVQPEGDRPRTVDARADGTTKEFEFPFLLDTPTQVAVAVFNPKAGRHTATKLERDRDFTVRLDGGAAGGAVTLERAPAAGMTVELRDKNHVRKIPNQDFTVSDGPWDRGGVVTLGHAPPPGSTVSLTDDRPLFGFVPVGLAYHMAYSILAAIMWGLAIRFAWPSDAEAFAEGETNPS